MLTNEQLGRIYSLQKKLSEASGQIISVDREPFANILYALLSEIITLKQQRDALKKMIEMGEVEVEIKKPSKKKKTKGKKNVKGRPVKNTDRKSKTRTKTSN